MYNDPNQPQQPYGQPQQPPYGQPYEQPPTQYSPPPPQGQPQYGAPPVAGYPQPQQQPKKSLRWLWITLAIIGGIVVLGCGGCIIASAAGIGFFASTVAGPTTAANSYYQAIKGQDYSNAYSYLRVDNFTVSGQQIPASQSEFATLATGIDTAKGKVTSYNQTSINVNNGTASVTMSVTRNGQTYDVHLELQQVNGNWKITKFDNL